MSRKIRIVNLLLLNIIMLISACTAETAPLTAPVLATDTIANSALPTVDADVMEETARPREDVGAVSASTSIPPASIPAPATTEAIATTMPTPFLEMTVTEEPTPAPFPTEMLPTPTFAAYGVTQTIGFSAQDRPLVSYQFGFGNDKIVLVGGIHGGYEWNTIVLAYELIDYFIENPQIIPHNVTLYIIPSANPDGQFVTTQLEGRITAVDVKVSAASARFNGNGVDLNRNWDCNWTEDAVWGQREVDAGKRPFSEPETQALRRFFLGQNIDAVIFLHSKANGVYSGGCTVPYTPSLELTNIYGEAAGYPIHEQFLHYPVTGDASDWLALQDIPSFSVELKTHNQLDWDENLAGTLAIIEHFQK